MSLIPFIHAMGRGPSRARSLTEAEAEDAMKIILSGDAAPEAVGALLMLMRYRGETAAEIAGFTRAVRSRLGDWDEVGATLDWPTYAAGRSRGLPWFLLSAKLVASAEYPVLLHGWNSHQNPIADVREAVRALSIPVAGKADCARTALDHHGIAYVPLEALCNELLGLLRLREVLGLRSCVNTVCRMLNPSAANAMVQGVFHPSYRALQQDAAALLGQSNLMVLKGGGGEFECNPAKPIMLYGLASGSAFETTTPVRIEQHRRLADPSADTGQLLRLWRGETADPWAEAIVLGTAAAAFLALGVAGTMTDADALVREQWEKRSAEVAA
jgi:anthranilate phosphoribosyltransferase